MPVGQSSSGEAGQRLAEWARGRRFDQLTGVEHWTLKRLSADALAEERGGPIARVYILKHILKVVAFVAYVRGLVEQAEDEATKSARWVQVVTFLDKAQRSQDALEKSETFVEYSAAIERNREILSRIHDEAHEQSSRLDEEAARRVLAGSQLPGPEPPKAPSGGRGLEDSLKEGGLLAQREFRSVVLGVGATELKVLFEAWFEEFDEARRAI